MAIALYLIRSVAKEAPESSGYSGFNSGANKPCSNHANNTFSVFSLDPLRQREPVSEYLSERPYE